MQLDQPLSDKEFNELDKFLLSDRCANDCMTMDSLHGYLTALAIGPQEILMAEWLPQVWGTSSDGPPTFKSEKECERIIGLIVRYMTEIAITLEVAPKEFEPLFCEHEWEGRKVADGEAWAWGFWEGMGLCEEAWQPIWDSSSAPLMRPIYLIKCHKLAIEIEAAIPEIYRFWLPHRKLAVTTVQRDAPKTGRNDDCPCGSGKKFKKCCGAEQILH
jgi:uncharacterized protein